MSREVLGDVCAYIKSPGAEKASYYKCGVAFRADDGRMSIKIDTLPIPGQWTGWLNIFPQQQQGERPPLKPLPKRAPKPFDDFDDDIPF